MEFAKHFWCNANLNIRNYFIETSYYKRLKVITLIPWMLSGINALLLCKVNNSKWFTLLIDSKLTFKSSVAFDAFQDVFCMYFAWCYRWWRVVFLLDYCDLKYRNTSSCCQHMLSHGAFKFIINCTINKHWIPKSAAVYFYAVWIWFLPFLVRLRSGLVIDI